MSRAALRQFARDRDVRFLDDPSNFSRTHLRNRVRLDLLPALEGVRPGFGDEFIALARRAALTRAEADAVAGGFVSAEAPDGTIRVARHELATYDSAALCVLWPAIAARARVTLDRRGTLRVAQFTTSGAPGARIQLSGGVEVYRHRDSFVIHRVERRAGPAEVALTGMVEFGRWRFQPIEPPGANPTGNADRETSGAMMVVGHDDPWTVDLPADCSLSVRAWAPADRMRAGRDGAARRVKRFLADARVAGPSRVGWPVVLAENEIVWIPGVRRAAAAPERSGRPVVRYTCGMCPNRAQ
jgi:tRNA(Ile)-lysidine synthase